MTAAPAPVTRLRWPSWSPPTATVRLFVAVVRWIAETRQSRKLMGPTDLDRKWRRRVEHLLVAVLPADRRGRLVLLAVAVAVRRCGLADVRVGLSAMVTSAGHPRLAR